MGPRDGGERRSQSWRLIERLTATKRSKLPSFVTGTSVLSRTVRWYRVTERLLGVY